MRSKWLQLAIIAITISVMNQLPYLRWIVYEPLRLALNLNNTDFAISMSAFGFLSLILYIPGGILADRFCSRWLFTLGAIFNGFIGFWLMSFPTPKYIILIHGLWAISNTMLVWPAMIKAVFILGSVEEQGKLFSNLETIRGISLVIINISIVTVLSITGNDAVGMKNILGLLSVLSLVCGLLSWLYLDGNSKNKFSNNKFSFLDVTRDIVLISKSPKSWACAGIMFCIYSIQISVSYINPFLQQKFEISSIVAGYMTVFRKDILKIFASTMTAFLSTRLKESNVLLISKFSLLSLFFIICIIVCFLFGFDGVVVFFLLSCISSMFIVGMRSLYFTLIDEMNIEQKTYGVASGFCSMIAFSPDIFQHVMFGYFIDKYGSNGYMLILGYSIVLLLAIAWLCPIVLKSNKDKVLLKIC